MDTRSRKGIKKHEEMHSGAANGNSTKTQGGADNVPLRGQRSSKRGPFDEKGLATNTNLFRQPCLANSGNKLQSNGKSSSSISTRYKKPGEVFPSTSGSGNHGPAHKTDPVTTRKHWENVEMEN
ncbi:hypothetical protein Tco_0419480 [Tanacetum coccineum]